MFRKPDLSFGLERIILRRTQNMRMQDTATNIIIIAPLEFAAELRWLKKLSFPRSMPCFGCVETFRPGNVVLRRLVTPGLYS